MIPLVSIWAVLALVVLALALYRKMLASKEDDRVRLADSDTAMIGQQRVLAQKLEAVDKWGKLLTIVVAAYGLLLAAYTLYNAWVSSAQMGG